MEQKRVTLVPAMNRKSKGIILAAIGMILFVLAIVVLLCISTLYLFALLLMFSSVVLTGVGSALVKGNDGSIEMSSEECYYCKGTGMIDRGIDRELCPRCGGTGLAREND